jgi:predicted nucleic acid-binding protein
VIFVDTGAWYAVSVPGDPCHAMAVAWLTSNNQPLITTDYIADETLTLLRSRGENARALHVGAELFTGSRCQLHYLTPAEIDEAWAVFSKYRDKEWSFTDCTSKVVIEKFSIAAAFSFDRHFTQFGTTMVVP